MVHRPLTVVRFGILVAATELVGCGGPPVTKAPVRPVPDATNAGSAAPEYGTIEGSWGKFHSKRFQLTVPLPDGHAWKIDDHRSPELVATHEPTRSRLTLVLTQEEDLMNRQRCEERARARGWVPARSLTTVDDQVHVGPDAYDSRVWIAIDASPPSSGGTGDAALGHVYLFGAFLRRCLLVHLSTGVPSSKDEAVLASRLAVAEARIVKAITPDPPRTTGDARVPRDKPDIRR